MSPHCYFLLKRFQVLSLASMAPQMRALLRSNITFSHSPRRVHGVPFGEQRRARLASSPLSSESITENSTAWLSLPELPKECHGESFRKCLEFAGIGRIAFVRHGNTTTTPELLAAQKQQQDQKYIADFDRMLSLIGQEQARQAGRTYGRKLLAPFYNRAVLVSPAPRAMDTARWLVSEAAAIDEPPMPPRGKATPPLIPTPILYDGTLQPGGSIMFQTIGYAPLQSYIAHSDPELRATAQRILGSYARNVICEIHRQVDENNNKIKSNDTTSTMTSTTTTLLVVGHSVYLPAAALGVAVLLGRGSPTPGTERHHAVLFEQAPDEAEGYLVDVVGNRPSLYLSRE